MATVAVLAGLMAAPITQAATANLTLNGGLHSAGEPKTTGAQPLAVSPGKVAGFYVTVKNNDTANLPTFFMSATSSAAPVGAYWFNSDGSGTAHSCDTSPMKCDFGVFASGTEVTIVAAFTLPGGTSNATTNCYPADPTKRTALMSGVLPDPVNDTFVCVDFKFSSSQGNVPGKNKSRGDEFHWMDFVSTKVDPKNEAAQFPYCDQSAPEACDSNLLSVSDNTTLSSNANRFNVQYTRVVVPASAFDAADKTGAIHVKDGDPQATVNCDADCLDTVNAAGGFLGEVSQIDINSGATFDPDWIVTTIGMLGINASKVDGVVHDVGTATPDMLGRCADASVPDPDTTPDAGCFWAVNGGANTAIVTVYTHGNGKLRNF
jgi:hypothetical protein